MTPKEAAAALDGNEYSEEGSPELFRDMKEHGLVAVFGASDDLMEFRGAMDDDAGCYEGGSVAVSQGGIPYNKCGDDLCPYYAEAIKKFPRVVTEWDDNEGFTFTTTIPHETFQILEDGEVYCRGIVFRLLDATPENAQKDEPT